MSPRSRSKPPVRHPGVAILGAGRVGCALGLGLQAAGWPVHLMPRSDAGRARAQSLGLPLATETSTGRAQLLFLAVPDGAVASVAKKISLRPEVVVVHCAGALSLEVLKSKRAPKQPHGSFHPLVAIPEPRASLEGAWVALAGDQPQVVPMLIDVAEALKLHPFEVPEENRALYHAGAVMSAGLVVSLVSGGAQALEAAGVAPGAARFALLALARSALDGLEKNGTEPALTGPAVRGDLEVIRRHLSALPPQLQAVYRAISTLIVDQAPNRVSGATRRSLLALLKAKGRLD